MNWIDVVGWLGAVLTASAYSMRDMKLLRIVAVAANMSFATYGFVSSVWPMLALHLFLLPLNLYRLSEIVSATKRLRRADGTGMPLDVLKPFLKPASFASGDVLFNRGDPPDKVYFLEEGEVHLPQLGKTIGSGTLFGEMAYFSPGKTRTTSAVCKSPCLIYAIDETDFMRLFHQNPEFGFYVIRLLAQRLVDGCQEHPHLYGDFADRSA